MKIILLTKNKQTMVDDDDFDKLSKKTWNYLSVGYARAGDGKTLMHRFIMNASNDQMVDHIDGNKLNNQKNNLRICTRSQNGMNAKKSKGNKSGYKGVSWNKQMKKWDARLMVNGKQIFIGLFDDVIEAAKAYNDSAKKYFGEYANVNHLVL